MCIRDRISSFYNIGTFAAGLGLSYLYSRYGLPKQIRQKPYLQPTLYPILYYGMVIIPISSRLAVHIHHWMIYGLLCLSSLQLSLPSLLTGFSFGLFGQGLCYSDRFDIICPNPYS